MSNVFHGSGKAEGPTATRSPSSAGTQYHLSKYLDNWIWEGSRSRHRNQWHCQQCHWEPASSCTTRSQTGRTEVGVFSAGWLNAEDDHTSASSKKKKRMAQKQWGKCLKNTCPFKKNSFFCCSPMRNKLMYNLPNCFVPSTHDLWLFLQCEFPTSPQKWGKMIVRSNPLTAEIKVGKWQRAVCSYFNIPVSLHTPLFLLLCVLCFTLRRFVG